MTDIEIGEHQHTELPETAVASMNDLAMNAEAYGLPCDPTEIMATALAVLRVMVVEDLVLVPRAALEGAGLTGVRHKAGLH